MKSKIQPHFSTTKLFNLVTFSFYLFLYRYLCTGSRVIFICTYIQTYIRDTCILLVMCIYKLIVSEFSTSFVLVSSLSIGYISDLVVVREMKTTFNFLPWHVRHANDEKCGASCNQHNISRAAAPWWHS